MAGRYGKKARKVPIEQLAIQHLTARHVSTRIQIRSRMTRTFGRKVTKAAITQATQVLSMCDPNFRPPL